jgi:hypothetical protein
MLRRRWVQFNLRFLFAALLATACVTWWFRPGVVKPEFVLERFSLKNDADSGKDYLDLYFRMTNAGPDSIWLEESKYDWRFEGDADENGVRNIGGGWGPISPPIQRVRLAPGKSTEFIVRLDEYARTAPYVRALRLGVDIADRRNRSEKRFWSPSVPVPHDALSRSPD